MKENLPHTTTVLGLMSGTSLDGLDLALCEFEPLNSAYRFKLIKTETVHYSAEWKEKLKTAQTLSTEGYFSLHAAYGKFMAEHVKQFLKGEKIQPDAIASHGHTVFHQPQKGFSTQIGCGATIAAHTQTTTVCDFRSLDVANHGQGAPLVPIGDELLFGNYEACLNLGGIANISFKDKEGRRVAYDVCEANLVLNFLSEKLGKSFDKAGEIARAGQLNHTLLHQLNSLDFYQLKGAKSLGREWLENQVLPLLEQSTSSVPDLLATAVEHISEIISADLNIYKLGNVLVTGGGAYNDFLIERIRNKALAELVIPHDTIIQFKEALIFAFLGYLRLHHKVNTLSSVTAARSNSIGGAVYVI